MSYIEGLARNFAIDITRHRKYNYSHQLLEEYLLLHPNIGCATFKVVNNRMENIETMLLKNKNATTCIVYAHGLGSNKLEGLSIAKYFMKQGFDLCSFDFSSSGRSEGEFTSYGLLEQEDVNAVIAHLDNNFKYQKYILWGRSMGSVAIILNQGIQYNPKVQCLVLDSPFSSFEKIAIELASKKSMIPQFMLQILIEPLKEYFQNRHPVNPFQLDICGSIHKIDCKILIIYSKNDSVVNYMHSKELEKYCRKNPTQIEIKQDHNMQRGKSTHQKILKFIGQCREENQRKQIFSRNRGRGISVASKQSKQKQSASGIRSTHKIKLTSSNSSQNYSRTQCQQRLIKGVSSLSQSIQYCKHIDTQYSPIKKKIMPISSLCLNDRMIQLANKQNIKPSLNMLRKNRFR